MISKGLLALSSLVVIALTAGCAVESAASDETEAATTVDALSASKVKLPTGDVCRPVLGSVALGLANGAVGLAYTTGVSVSLTSETEYRTYTVSIGRQGAGPVSYEVVLENDSSFKCLLLSAKLDASASLGTDVRSGANARELTIRSPIALSPPNDDCRSTLRLLGYGAGISAVGPKQLLGVSIALESATETRDYTAHVDGKAFVANGQKFDNDLDYTFELSNDSASKCLVESVKIK